MIYIDQQIELRELMGSMFRPVADVEVWRWAEENICLRATETEASGMYSSELTPFIRKILEFFRDPSARVLTIMAGTQVVKTMALMLGGSYWIAHNQGRALWVMDTEHNARSFSKTRWKALLEDSPGTTDLVPRNKDDFQNLEQYLGGVILNFVGANSPGNLAQRGADLVLIDEEDKFPHSTEDEGDAVTQVDQRMKARGKAKKVECSSPTTTSGLIWRGFQGGTMEEWFIPCPHCSGEFVLETGNEDVPVGKIVWDQTARGEDGDWDWERIKETARIECPHCKGLLDDGQKVEAVAAGEWRVMNPGAEPGHWSFHIASHNSPWQACRIGELAVEWLRMKKRFDLRSWDKYWRGWPSIDEVKKPEAARLMARREHWQGNPPGALLYTVGIDTQDDRLEAQVIGWGAGLENWRQEYAVFHGNPGHSTVWRELLGYLVDLCQTRRVTAIGIDSGGHFTDEVYLFCQQNQKRIPIYAMKGASTAAKMIISRPTRIKSLGIKLFLVGTGMAKERIYSMLTIAEKGAGYCHFRDTLDDRFFEGLVSEDVKLVWKNGRQVRKWVQNTERNEPLDTNVYALAALHIRGIHEVTRKLGQMEIPLPSDKDDADPDAEAPAPVPPPRTAPPRRAANRRARGPGRGFGF